MATRFTVEEALMDDDFDLCDGEASDEGKEIYGYIGEPVLRRTDVEGVGESLVDGPPDNRDDDDARRK